MKIRAYVIVAAVLFFSLPSFADSFSEWHDFSRSPAAVVFKNELKKYAVDYLQGKKCVLKNTCSFPHILARHGVFVTVIKNRKVRGCYGSLDHQTDDFTAAVIFSLKEALRADPRYDPPGADEIEDCDIIVTVTSDLCPVAGIDEVDIRQYGVILEKGDMRTVIVPAEFKTYESLRRIIASVKPDMIYSFKAVTIK
jgi:hypothetical protein